MSDPWAEVSKAEIRVVNMRYRHKAKLVKVAAAHAKSLEILQHELMHLEIDIRSGRPREKLADTLRVIRLRLAK